MNVLKFSGHDTFHCRQQWLLKGIELINNEDLKGFSNLEESILNLGVGKNMVQAIQYWLRAFGLINDDKQITPIANLIFSKENGFDRYLENEGTLWLLQYLICKTEYSSIYKLIFSDYIKERISNEFDENQIIKFIKSKVVKDVSENTLKSDIKVFIQSYYSSNKTSRSLEDDYNSPLIELNLLSTVNRNDDVITYKLNNDKREDFPIEIFGYCLLDLFNTNTSIQFKEIRQTLCAYFVLSNDGLEVLIEKLCFKYPEFIFNDDAGVRQIQIKVSTENFKLQLLQVYYGV